MFGVVLPCSLIDSYQCFGETLPKNRGSRFHQNVGRDLPVCMSSHSSRQLSSNFRYAVAVKNLTDCSFLYVWKICCTFENYSLL